MSSRSRMRERDLLLFVFNKKQQMLVVTATAQHDQAPFFFSLLDQRPAFGGHVVNLNVRPKAA